MAFLCDDELLISENKGNYKELIDLLERHDQRFAYAIKNRPGNATCTSPEIQNELLKLCADQVIEKIVAEVKQSKHFSLIADESSDNYMHELLALSLRYLNTNCK
jgi:hypothetical protein